MAEPRKTTPSAGTPVLSDDDTRATPAPPATLHVTPWTLSGKQALHRVHSVQYRADEFNPGLKGNARFSPIQDVKGDPIPTIYAAATFDAAAMESVFHDVSHAPGFKHYDKRKLDWISRQDDSTRAVVLFGDRIPKGTLKQFGDSRSLLQGEPAYAELLDLADRIGVDITPGN